MCFIYVGTYCHSPPSNFISRGQKAYGTVLVVCICLFAQNESEKDITIWIINCAPGYGVLITPVQVVYSVDPINVSLQPMKESTQGLLLVKAVHTKVSCIVVVLSNIDAWVCFRRS
jgi:hypothetical protein